MKSFKFRQETEDSRDHSKEKRSESKGITHGSETMAVINDIAKAHDGKVGDKAAGGGFSKNERVEDVIQDGVQPSNSPKITLKIAAEEETLRQINMSGDPKNSPLYDEKDLDASLKILKRIMNMESAQPFNAPVDPVVLGIPDYYQVIETPMDFGTIRHLLENREKYLNSQDVCRDIQLIWMNCRKYNRKGDPILEMMKKVQKACSKFWTATGHLRNLKARRAPVDQVLPLSIAREHKFSVEGGKRSYFKDHNDVTSQLANANTFDIFKKQKNTNGIGVASMADTSSGDDDESENDVDVQDLEGTGKVFKHVKVAIGHENSTVSSRRVCGNNHHKDGCTCVVCAGIRRKLAREKKLVSLGKDLPKDSKDPSLKRKSKGERGRGEANDGQAWFVEDDLVEAICRDGVAKVIENQEDLAHYYPANYQIPLKKIDPFILAFGQVIFGCTRHSVWSRHSPLVPAQNPPMLFSDNPLKEAVSTLCLSERDDKK